MKKRLLSLVLAVVMLLLALPTMALPLFAAVEKNGTSVKETYRMETDFSVDCTTNSKDTSVAKLYKWYFPDGTPVKGESTAAQDLSDDCYATYHPDLVGTVFNESDSYEVILEKYAAYLKSKANVVIAGNWELGTMLKDGTYLKTEKRLLAVTQSIYAIRINSKGNYIMEDIWYEENPRLTNGAIGASFIDAMIAKAVDLPHPDGDGKILLSEIKGAPHENSYVKLSGTSGLSVWYDGSYFWNQKLGGFQLSGVADPGDGSSAAYVYTIPEKVDGPIKLSMENIYFPTASQASGNSLCITKNGEVVWPAGAVLSDYSTYYAIKGPGDAANIAADELAKLNTALAEANVTAKTGDKIAFVFTRTASRSRLQASPAVEYEEKVSVQFVDKDDNLLVSYALTAGSAMPKAPYNPGEAGFLINGAAGALPATVTEDIVVKYVDDHEANVTPVTVEKASISVASDFSLNVFVKIDPYAKRAGLANAAGREYWGEEQADGTWKITLPGISAKEMGKEQKLYLFQEFDDGVTIDNKISDQYAVTPTEVLAAYADSDASAGEKAIAAAALNYALAADAYFNGTALSADVKASLAAQDAAIAAISSDVKVADKQDLCVNGMVLVVREQIYFKLRVASSMYMPIEEEMLDYVVAVEANGTETEYTGFVYTEGDEGYSMTMTLGKVMPSDFDVAHKITVKDGSLPVSETFSYSVNDYIARTFDADAREADLLRAIYALGVAAENA